MTAATYDKAMTAILAHEGGYTNHPADPGGPTNWGITLHDAQEYWKANATASDVRAMPLAVAKDIYRKHYAFPVRYNDLPAGVDYAVLDYAVNSGTGRAGRVLRRLCGLPDTTSAIDDTVVAAVAKRKPDEVIAAICTERLAFLQSLSTWDVFGDGWGRRVREVKSLALTMASQPVVPVIPPRPAPSKAQVPEPKTTKNAVVSGGSIGAMVLIAWAHQHPALAVVSIVAAGAMIGGAIYLINRWHQAKQHAATPGIAPVKEAA